MKVSLSWLRDYVEIRLKPRDLAQRLTMAGLEVTSIYEFGDDVIFDIEVTPNRTDCFSIIGIAREAAAITARNLKLPKSITRLPQNTSHNPQKLKIDIKDKQGCRRYIGRLISNVSVAPSPKRIASRLNALGIRAVNNVVDITNYCLFELGQPLHVFDYDKLEGGRIIIRQAREGEEIVTIDGVRRKLDAGILVIADKFKPIAIAGVMGGKDTEVTETTKRVLLESAHFNPVSVRKTSQKLGLTTESSYRFERGVNFDNVFFSSKRASELISQFAKGKEKAVKDAPKSSKREKLLRINLPLELIKKTLGISISGSKVEEILDNLQFNVVRDKSKNELKVTAPSFRQDVTRAIDLIEEIARIFGYDNVPPTIPDSGLTLKIPTSSSRQKIERKTKQVLAGLGFDEVVTYSLISRKLLSKLNLSDGRVVEVKNPISYEQEIMRPILTPNIIDIASWNLNRKAEGLKIFELSSVYSKNKNGFIEDKHLCFAISGTVFEDWAHKVKIKAGFFIIKGAVETLLERLGIEGCEFKDTDSPYIDPAEVAAIVLPSGEEVGVLGRVKNGVLKEFDINNNVYVCEINFEMLLPHIKLLGKFRKVSKHPSVFRDIAVLVKKDVSSQSIMSIVNKIGGDIVNKVKFFDEYSGEQIPPKFRSLAYSVEYQAEDRTLQDEEVNKIHSLICKELAEKLQAEIR